LNNVTIPDSVTIIGKFAFYSCTSLTNITISTNVTRLADGVFRRCALTGIKIPNGVTSIGITAFAECVEMASIVIPSSVTNIGSFAFQGCSNLAAVFFIGNAPNADLSVFYGDALTVYYLPGTAGWGEAFQGYTTALWRPQMSNVSCIGVQTNQFGFNINWAPNRVVVVEACTSLVNPSWSPIGTNILTEGCAYFSDASWTDHPKRFYRIRSP
jgi:hypothetical protein